MYNKIKLIFEVQLKSIQMMSYSIIPLTLQKTGADPGGALGAEAPP